MKVLVTGESEVLARSTIDAVRARRHEVRLLSDMAAIIAGEWPGHVEARSADGGKPDALVDAARGCDAIVDLTALDAQHDTPDTRTADEEWQHLLDAAARANVGRLVYVCPRHGKTSPAQQLDPGQDIAHRFRGERLVLRTNHVYGTTSDLVSQLLIMMRSLPAVPIVGDHRFVIQPIWHEDLAAATAAGVDVDGAHLETALELAGPDTLTQEDMYERIAALIDRRPLRLPLPEFLATRLTSLAGTLRLLPQTYGAQLEALRDVPQLDAAANALTSVFGITATRFDTGLARLANELLEQPPSEGVGTLQVKRFSVDIHGSAHDPATVLRLFRRRFADVMPVGVGVEPVSPETELTAGATLTLALPGRGHVQIRVEEVTDEHVIVATLYGHALAGIVRFGASAVEHGVRFEIITCDTSGSAMDWIALTAGGARVQDANWHTVLQNVASLAGGTGGNVQSDIRNVKGDEAEQVGSWVRSLIRHRRRTERT